MFLLLFGIYIIFVDTKFTHEHSVYICPLQIGMHDQGHRSMPCRVKIPCEIPCKLKILCFRTELHMTEDIQNDLDKVQDGITRGFSNDSYKDVHWDVKKDGKGLADSLDNNYEASHCVGDQL